jgi:hypothetical protein
LSDRTNVEYIFVRWKIEWSRVFDGISQETTSGSNTKRPSRAS